jgi:hypothetical protein
MVTGDLLIAKRMNWMAWGLAAVPASALVGMVALHGLDLLRYALGVPVFRAVDYDPDFTRRARAALPVIAALNRYRSKHSTFPANAAQLARCFPPGSVRTIHPGPYFIMVRGWHYYPDRGGKGYGLSRKIDWDAGFSYEYDGSKGHWIFSSDDLPDGPGSKEIVLKP